MSMSNPEETNLPALGTTHQDRIVSAVSAMSSAIPMVGSIVAEVITQLIPNQRIERIEKYIKHLLTRFEALDSEVLRQKMRDPKKLDLFEEGAFQSVRGLSEERLEYIAKIVGSGISGEQVEEPESRRLLNILGSITDDQTIILASYLHKNRAQEFWDRHSDVLLTEPATLGATQDVVDQETISKLARQQLAALGVLRLNFARPRRGQLPEFDDKTGMIKSRGYTLTPLGRLLLRKIGLAEADEF